MRLKQPLTQDTLENYFENKRKSGGGDIDSLTIIKGTEMEVEEVLITFSESKGTCIVVKYNLVSLLCNLKVTCMQKYLQQLCGIKK